MKVLVAPNAFKGSLDASTVAAAISAGFRRSSSHIYSCEQLPIADGGDGSLPIIMDYLGAQTLESHVHGPMGWQVKAKYGWIADKQIGIVEMAEASGIRYLHKDQLDPWNASSYGTGELIRILVEKGAREIFLTVGGSASVDGALGILLALGAKFKHSKGAISQPLTSDMHRIQDVDLTEVSALLANTSITVLCDVTNPLLGPNGAAAVFAPQKGASPADVQQLEASLKHWSEVIAQKTNVSIGDMKHAGAAGGVPGVLHALLGAKVVSGGDQILLWAGFDEALEQADIVVTAEGKIDAQTAFGKGPGIIAKRAKTAGKYVIGLCGMVDPEPQTFENFDLVLPVSHGAVTINEAYAYTAANLERTAMMVGNLLPGIR